MIGNLNKKVTHINRDIILVTDTYTADITDDIILCNGTFTLTLPVLPQDREIMFKVINIGIGVITISRSTLRAVKVANSNLIDGVTTIILKDQYNSIVLLSHLSNYYSVGKVDTWDKILSTINTFSVGDSDGDGNGTKITINDTGDTITIDATAIALTSSAISGVSHLDVDTFNQLFTTFQTKWIKGADIISAPDLTIPTDGSYFDITGVTTIETFDNSVGVGTIIAFQFDDILTIENHATIKLPASANITTQAGDIAIFIQDTITSYKLIGYQRQDGTSLTINIVNDTTPQLGGDLDLNQNNITLDPIPTSDLTWNGLIITGTAGENLSFGVLVYLKSDGKFWKTDANTEAQSSGILAIVTETILTNATGILFLKGFIRDDGWAWTVGEVLYIHPSPGNFLSGVPVASGDVIRKVGHAYNANVIYFNPDNYYTVIP